MNDQTELDMYVVACATANRYARHAKKRAQEGSPHARHWQNIANDWAVIALSLRPASKS